RIVTGAEAMSGVLGQPLGVTMQRRDVGEHRLVTGIGPDADEGAAIDELGPQCPALQRDPTPAEWVAEGDVGDRRRDLPLSRREDSHVPSLLLFRPLYPHRMWAILQGMSASGDARAPSPRPALVRTNCLQTTYKIVSPGTRRVLVTTSGPGR